MVSTKILVFAFLVVGGSCLVNGDLLGLDLGAILDDLLSSILGGGKGGCEPCKPPKNMNDLSVLIDGILKLLGLKLNLTVGLNLGVILSLLGHGNLAQCCSHPIIGKQSWCNTKHDGKGPWRGRSKAQIIIDLRLGDCRSQLEKYRKQREGKMTNYEKAILRICVDLLDILHLNMSIGERCKRTYIQIVIALGIHCRHNTKYSNDQIKSLLSGLLGNCNTHLKKHNLAVITDAEILAIIKLVIGLKL